MVELSAVAIAVLRAVRDALVHGPHRALTVGELTGVVGVGRGVLDAAVAELDDAGLIRLRGDVGRHGSHVALTDAGERVLDGID